MFCSWIKYPHFWLQSRPWAVPFLNAPFQRTCWVTIINPNKNATHKKRVVTQTFVVHKWSVTITDHLKKTHLLTYAYMGPTPPPKTCFTHMDGRTYRLMVITLSVWYMALWATTCLKKKI